MQKNITIFAAQKLTSVGTQRPRNASIGPSNRQYRIHIVG